MANDAPIGIFDSGVGGLSIAKEIRKLLPNENLIYFADSAYCPYGEKLPAVIKQRVFTICDFLISLGAKILVVACNTASIVSLDDIRHRYQVPVVGVEPAVKSAVTATKTGTIGVLATSVTLSGDRFSALVKQHCSKTNVITQPCPGLVGLVEGGQLNSSETKTSLTQYLKPLLKQQADVIVLGCTHYPFLKPMIKEIAGDNIKILDTGAAVARQTAHLLSTHHLQTTNKQPGTEEMLTSGDRSRVEPVVQLLWGNPVLKVNYAD